MKQDLCMQTAQNVVQNAMSTITLCSLRYHVSGLQAADDLHQELKSLQIGYHPKLGVACKPLRLSVYQRCQNILGGRLAQTQMIEGQQSLAAWQCTMERKQKGELLLLLLSANLVTCACRIKQQDWSRSMPLSFRNACSAAIGQPIVCSTAGKLWGSLSL